MTELIVLSVVREEVFGKGLEHILSPEPEIKSVSTCVYGTDDLKEAFQIHPAVVLIDSDIPEHDFIKVRQLIREKLPDSRVIVLVSSQLPPDTALSYFAADLDSFLPKTGTERELVPAVVHIVNGDIIIHSAIAPRLSQWMHTLSSHYRESYKKLLTDRENSVLELLAEGRSNKDIGTTLTISEHTVKVHVSRILKKLMAGNRQQAVRFALEQGLVNWRVKANK